MEMLVHMLIAINYRNTLLTHDYGSRSFNGGARAELAVGEPKNRLRTYRRPYLRRWCGMWWFIAGVWLRVATTVVQPTVVMAS